MMLKRSENESLVWDILGLNLENQVYSFLDHFVAFSMFFTKIGSHENLLEFSLRPFKIVHY